MHRETERSVTHTHKHSQGSQLDRQLPSPGAISVEVGTQVLRLDERA